MASTSSQMDPAPQTGPRYVIMGGDDIGSQWEDGETDDVYMAFIRLDNCRTRISTGNFSWFIYDRLTGQHINSRDDLTPKPDPTPIVVPPAPHEGGGETVATIRERRAAITPGEWYRQSQQLKHCVVVDRPYVPHPEEKWQLRIAMTGYALAPASLSELRDAEFIAHAPADIDTLLARLDAAEARAASAEAALAAIAAQDKRSGGLRLGMNVQHRNGQKGFIVGMDYAEEDAGGWIDVVTSAGERLQWAVENMWHEQA